VVGAVRATPLPPGRGVLVRRRRSTVIQTVHQPAALGGEAAVRLAGLPVQTLLVTVVGQRGRLDLEVPAHVPVGKLLPALLRLVGEPAGGPGPAALVAHTGRPLPERASLAESGTLEGALLWLARAHPPGGGYAGARR
jgi:hypothetical protein